MKQFTPRIQLKSYNIRHDPYPVQSEFSPMLIRLTSVWRNKVGRLLFLMCVVQIKTFV